METAGTSVGNTSNPPPDETTPERCQRLRNLAYLATFLDNFNIEKCARQREVGLLGLNLSNSCQDWEKKFPALSDAISRLQYYFLMDKATTKFIEQTFDEFDAAVVKPDTDNPNYFERKILLGRISMMGFELKERNNAIEELGEMLHYTSRNKQETDEVDAVFRRPRPSLSPRELYPWMSKERFDELEILQRSSVKLDTLINLAFHI